MTLNQYLRELQVQLEQFLLNKMKSSIFLIFGITLFSISLANSESFNGYQVLRVNITTEDHLNTIDSFAGIDVWKEPEVGSWGDIMVNPSNLPHVTKTLNKKNFSWRVLIPDVGRVIEEQRLAREKNVRSATLWEEYQTLEQIFAWIDSQVALHPDFVSTHTIGQTYEKRDMRLLKISKPNANGTPRPAVFLDSGIHAREWISPATLTYVLDRLLNDPQYADILAGVDIHALPVLNADGYSHTHTTFRMWRKNRRPTQGTENIGTDLNRNFPYQWCTVGASNDSASENFCGAWPGSEPETDVVTNYLLQDINWWGLVTLHSYGQEWCIPWAYTATHAPDYDDMWAVGQKAVDALEAVNGVPFVLKIPSGRYGGFSMDWAKGVLKIKYPVLIELRDTGEHGFLLPPDQIIPSGEETLAAIAVYLREIIAESTPPATTTTAATTTTTPSSNSSPNVHAKLQAFILFMMLVLSIRNMY